MEGRLAWRDKPHKVRARQLFTTCTSGIGDRRQDIAWEDSLTRRNVPRDLASSKCVEVARVHAN